MNTKKALAIRIQELISSRDLSVNALARSAGIPPTTIYSMLNQKSQNPGIVSIKKICEGLGISLREFFDSELWSSLTRSFSVT